MRLHQAIESAAEAPGPAKLATALDNVAVPSTLGADIEEALARAEGIGELISEQLRVALIDLGEAPELRIAHSPASENTFVGQHTWGDTWWWDVVVDVPGETFAWAERAATELLRSRNAADPFITEVAATHPVREILLLADTLVRYRWLEGAARIHVALAMTLQVETLADLIPALLKGPKFTRRPEIGNRLLHLSLVAPARRRGGGGWDTAADAAGRLLIDPETDLLGPAAKFQLAAPTEYPSGTGSAGSQRRSSSATGTVNPRSGARRRWQRRSLARASTLVNWPVSYLFMVSSMTFTRISRSSPLSQRTV
ncbi:hypothetical protein ACQPZP_04860 [Spirillospora sp. CA-142024]|uniref:hypothetical protein n=1 Tax=Spirillospora sp. CA-142024 TaxID=3240036 RepID=UPI003D93A3BF